MGSKINPPYSLALVATVTLLLLAQGAEARVLGVGVGVNKFCRTSSHKPLCTSMVRGARTWHDAVSNAIHLSLATATSMQKMLPTVGPTLKGIPSISKNSAIQTCSENFNSAVDNLKDALGFLEKKDSGSLNTYLSAVSITDCIDAFDQFHTPFPSVISKVAKQLDGQISECLAVSQQI